MLKEESNNWARARVCDTCRSAASAVYCRADSAYLCGGCDARIHAANRLASRHKRVWVCEACERAPAAFICKADAASLCAACDADIHSANPLARRHHRVPVLPIPSVSGGSVAGPTAADDDGFQDDQDEASSWLLLNPIKNNTTKHNGNGFLFGGEVVDEYLDLEEYNSCQENQFTEHYNNQQHQQYDVVPQKSFGGDSVVPSQQQQQHQHHKYQLGMMEYENPKTGYGYPTSMSHSVSISSMDVSVVPIHMPPQLTPMDREARVLRYREKKKTRKFEKTIRYASRKAYAETRPRIKGRFAKRTDMEFEVDQMFSSTLMADGGYGIVPSF